MTSGRRIDDEFSSVPSKQRRWQLRREAEGKCHICGQPALADMRHCKPCAEHRRRVRRKKRDVLCRYENTKFTRALELEKAALTSQDREAATA